MTIGGAPFSRVLPTSYAVLVSGAVPFSTAVIDADSRIVPMAEMERQAILATIEQVKGDKLMAARLLKIGKTTLYRKLKEYDSHA